VSYRDDPEWQQARAIYIEPGEELSVTKRMLKRITAVKQMQVIECRHLGVPVEELDLSWLPRTVAVCEGERL
jgi:hypothetical protein